MWNTINQNSCLSLGGIRRIWIAPQTAGENGIASTTDDAVEIILDRKAFQMIDCKRGNFTESISNDVAGQSVSTTITFEIIKGRKGLISFENRYFNKKLMAVILTNNKTQRIFRNLRLSRTSNSGNNYTDKNAFTFQLNGNSTEQATFAISREAIFWFQTDHNHQTDGEFDPEITFNGLGRYIFANGDVLDGNSINTGGGSIPVWLNGETQTVTFDSETGAEGITELHFRNDSITGIIKLDLLPNISKADLAFNKIESLTIGSWIHNQNIIIELRDNRISPEAQEQFLELLYSSLSFPSNMKIGMLNQKDAQGNQFIPTERSIELAVLLYDAYGVEIYLDSTRPVITI